jgi:hypothetical protein
VDAPEEARGPSARAIFALSLARVGAPLRAATLPVGETGGSKGKGGRGGGGWPGLHEADVSRWADALPHPRGRPGKPPRTAPLALHPCPREGEALRRSVLLADHHETAVALPLGGDLHIPERNDLGLQNRSNGPKQPFEARAVDASSPCFLGRTTSGD